MIVNVWVNDAKKGEGVTCENLAIISRCIKIGSLLVITHFTSFAQFTIQCGQHI